MLQYKSQTKDYNQTHTHTTKNQDETKPMTAMQNTAIEPTLGCLHTTRKILQGQDCKTSTCHTRCIVPGRDFTSYPTTITQNMFKTNHQCINSCSETFESLFVWQMAIKYKIHNIQILYMIKSHAAEVVTRLGMKLVLEMTAHLW